MILYVNGDSHTAAAEATNAHAFACDDGNGELWRLGRRPHPDNDRVSWGWRLSNLLDTAYINDSESASSNYRIMRTTRDWIASVPDSWHELLVIIQWSTWEREEWLIDGEWYQINASGVDDVPPSHRDRYRQYVIDVDWHASAQIWHDRIWQFHQDLEASGIMHVFFNGNSHFGSIRDRQQWGVNYMHPYCPDHTFDQILRANDFATVSPQSWHFGADAHCFWSQYVLQYCVDNKLVKPHALCTD